MSKGLSLVQGASKGVSQVQRGVHPSHGMRGGGGEDPCHGIWLGIYP